MPIYMSIEGLPGLSTAKGHEKSHNISSFSWGASRPPQSAPRFTEFNVFFNPLASASKMMLACANGQHFDRAVIESVKSSDGGEVPYLVITLTDVLISSFQQAGSEGEGSPPGVAMSLNFSKIEYRTFWGGKGGIVSQVNWFDLKQGKGG